MSDDRRKLLWQHLAPFGGLLVAALLILGVLASRTVSRFYYHETERQLTYHLKTISQTVLPLVLAGNQQNIDHYCKRGTKGEVIRFSIIAPDGRVLGDSSADPATMENHSDRPEIQLALAGRTGRAIRFSATLHKELLYVARPVREGKRIVAVARIAIPNEMLTATIGNLGQQLLLFGIITLLLMMGSFYTMYRSLAKTAANLIHGADRFARGELTHQIMLEENSYLASLASTMNLMAGQLETQMAELRSQRRELDVILSSMSEAIVAVTDGGTVLQTNDAFCTLFELSPTGVTGGNLFEVLHSAELHDYIKKVIAGEQPDVEEVIYCRGAAKHYLAVSGNQLRPEGGQVGVAIIVITDITRIKRLELIRRDFVANVSHELKTPVTVIKGCGETLRGAVEHIPTPMPRFLAKIISQTERMEHIIEDLLALSRLEAGEESSFNMSDQKLVAMVRQAVTPLEEKAASRGNEVVVSIPAQVTVKANAPLLIQAFTNLVDNALKYGAEGSKVEVEAILREGHVRVEVRDHGEGIAHQHLSRLFERFYRVDKGRSKQLGGTGLGLAIVKHVINIHGGTVGVESELGEGSRFFVDLPRSDR